MKQKLLVLLAILLVCTSCSFGNNSTKNTLRLAIERDLSTLNYQKTASTVEMEQIGQVMEGLLGFDENGEVIAAGATAWTISDDGVTYTFKLREDAKWADGSVVIAADYYFAWLEIVANKTSSFAYTLFPIKNAEAIYNGELDKNAFGVKVLDDFNLEITLEKPYLSFIYSLATATMFPIKQTFYDEVGSDNFGTTKETILTNGAYNIKEYEAASNFVLEKSDTYWDKKNVLIEHVEVYVVKEASTRSVMFDEGELDLMTLSTDYIEKYQNSKLQILQLPTSKITYLYLSGNTLQENELLANDDFRKAISYGIDKNLLTDNILKDGSTPLTRIVPCHYAYVEGQDYCDLVEIDDEALLYDTDLAQAYYEKARVELGAEALSFEIYYQESESNTKVLENIKYQLEHQFSGLTIKLVAMAVSGYSATLRKNGVASAIQTWSASFPNPELYLQILEQDSSFNFGKYSDDVFQTYYHTAMATTDLKKQFEKYGLAEKQALSSYMFIPLYQNGLTYILNDTIKTFDYKMTLPYIQYKNIRLQ